MRLPRSFALAGAILPFLLSPAVGHASLTEAQAEQKAQVVQDGQCGRGASWLCDNKRFPESHCTQGYGHWDCNGGVRQVSFWGSGRTCGVYTTVQSGVATLRDNSCF